MAAATLPTTDDAGEAESPPDISQLPRALKDRAFDLYSRGFHSPAIAAQLGVPERTIRNWVQTIIQQLAQDDVAANPEIARQQRALAIESQRAVVATAWTAYQQLSDSYTRLMDRALAPTNSQPERLIASVNRLAATAARHLAVVVSANREIARLQGQAVAQAARDQHAASRQAAADASDLLRILTMPLSAPATQRPALDDLPSMHDVPTPDILSTVAPAREPGSLGAPDIPPLPDHIIAAVMDHHRKMYPDDTDGPCGPDAPPRSPPPLSPHAPLSSAQGRGPKPHKKLESRQKRQTLRQHSLAPPASPAANPPLPSRPAPPAS